MLLTLAPLLFSPTEAQVTPQIAPQLQPQVQPQVAPQEGPGTTPQAPLDIQYNKFSRTTCMASSGPVLTSKPGDCITLQHADQGIRVHATNLNVQCKCKLADALLTFFSSFDLVEHSARVCHQGLYGACR